MKSDRPSSKGRPTFGYFMSRFGRYQESIWHGVAQTARKHNANVLCFAGGELSSQIGFQKYWNVIYDLAGSANLDGIIVLTAALQNYVTLNEMKQFVARYAPLPVVSIGQKLDEVPSITVDNYTGMRAVMKHLIEGHHYSRIAFIRGARNNPEAAARYRAYTQELKNHGIPLDSDLVAPGDFNITDGAEAVSLFLDRRGVRFEALVSSNDNMAIGACQELTRRGVNVPGDVAITGFDDLPEARSFATPLTTVRQPLIEQGRVAAELLMEYLHHGAPPGNRELETEMIVRESCGCLPEPAVLAPASPAISTILSGISLTRQRDAAAAEIRQVICPFYPDISPRSLEPLVDAFWDALQGGPPAQFLKTFDSLLRMGMANLSRTEIEGGIIFKWQEVLSILREKTLPYAQPDTAVTRDGLLYQASTLIAGAVERVNSNLLGHTNRIMLLQSEIVRDINAALSPQQAIDVLALSLPKLGVNTCALAIYGEGPIPPKESRLIMAYHNGARIDLGPQGRIFPSEQLIPPDMLSGSMPPFMVIHPLAARDKHFGYIVMEMAVGARSTISHTYEEFSEQIGSALHSALLTQEITLSNQQLAQRADELAGANMDLGLAEEALRRDAARLALVHEIDRGIMAAHTPREIAEAALGHIRELVPCAFVGVVLLDFDTGQASILASSIADLARYRTGETWNMPHKIPGDVGRWLKKLRQGLPVVIKDVSPLTARVPPLHMLSEIGLRACTTLPLRFQDELVGFISLGFDRPAALSFEHLEIAGELANQLAIAIRQAQVFEAERDQRMLAEALRDNAALLNGTLYVDEVLDRMFDNLRQVFEQDYSDILLIDSGMARIARSHAYVSGRSRAGLHDQYFPVADTADLREMAETGSPMMIVDTRLDPDWIVFEGREWIRSYAGAPILLDGKAIGFLGIASDKPGFFTLAQVQRLQAFADQAAVAIRNARLYHELEDYSSFLEQIVRDRTAELQRSKDYTSTILDSVGDGLMVLTPDGYIQQVNPAFVQQTGYDGQEAAGRLYYGLLGSGARLKNEQWKRLESLPPGKAWHGETSIQCKDGSQFDAALTISPAHDAEGHIIFLVASIRDITPLKEVERAKDEFVSNVSHELRTPLTSIKLNAELMRRNPAGQERYMARLERELDRLNRLIEDLLRLSRLDQGSVQLDLEPLDLNELAEQYVDDRAALAESRSLRLVCKAARGLPPVEADSGLLGQALSVLLTNALAYTPASGQVTIGTHRRKMNGRQWAGFSVSDTGPGIPPEEQSQLFTRFFRGTAGRKSGAPGTGLGLAIAREIVNKHGGLIDITSTGIPGHGATFTVWLPVPDTRPPLTAH